ncbi:PREDICTED: hemogen isoform X2 [Thamnophis sirtalis]|uniref:Hemogen isoform X2 n=1 Tax=Thamnophis sirtalis TaxID=35019 RepID=A0A6I9YQW0_9SAUR|nr:PREDICTED: hemogen isoform X2 [Thamnophis sirtalis]XP_032070288.1 hemogen isoform X2 [Thamnophis elegans]
MANLEKDHSYSETPQQAEATPEEYAVADVGISHRLRDRELLRKRRAEAEEKDTEQEQKRHKRARKGRATGRARGRRQTPQPEPQPELQSEKAESHETQVTTVEEKPEVTHGLHEEYSVPLVVTEGLYSQEEITPSVFRYAQHPGLEETPRPEGSEDPQSLENDHLEQNLFGF